jgi:hypothetical protein
MRYDLSQNTIISGNDFLSSIEDLNNGKERLDKQSFSDLVSMVMDDSEPTETRR